jgi:flagellar hook assembly protein FlgD
MTGFTLPNNAVLVEAAPQITNVSADPNFFDPSTGNFLTPENPTTRITFDLSKQATVTLQVFHPVLNRLVHTITAANLPAGTHTLEWDGRNQGGILVDRGDYRLALKATDSSGNQSIVRYVLVRVFY